MDFSNNRLVEIIDFSPDIVKLEQVYAYIHDLYRVLNFEDLSIVKKKVSCRNLIDGKRMIIKLDNNDEDLYAYAYQDLNDYAYPNSYGLFTNTDNPSMIRYVISTFINRKRELMYFKDRTPAMIEEACLKYSLDFAKNIKPIFLDYNKNDNSEYGQCMRSMIIGFDVRDIGI